MCQQIMLKNRSESISVLMDKLTNEYFLRAHRDKQIKIGLKYFIGDSVLQICNTEFVGFHLTHMGRISWSYLFL